MSDRARAREVIAVESRISSIVDDHLTYRGIAIESLFAHSTFEETVFLLWFGQLPSRSDLEAFRARISATYSVNDELVALILRAAAGGTTFALEAGVIGLGLQKPQGEDAIALSVSLLTAMPFIVANLERSRRAMTEVSNAGGESISERFLTMCRAQPISPENVRAFDRGLVLVADHELNAATFAARVAASTGADPFSVVLAAFATQSGPLHGGAMVRAGELLQQAMVNGAEREIDRRLSAGERIPGFGHSVYRNGDPRAALFRQLVVEAAERERDRRWLDTADAVALIATERIGLAPNLDLYAAAFWSGLDFPADLFPALFSIGRVAGWIAHMREQAADNRLIRPRAHYSGRTNEPYIPIDDRSEWFTRSGM